MGDADGPAVPNLARPWSSTHGHGNRPASGGVPGQPASPGPPGQPTPPSPSGAPRGPSGPSVRSTDPGGSDTPDRASLGAIDGKRVRSFIGLSVGLVGPRANLAVSGVLITLYVQQRSSGALAVTFALTANRLLSWMTYPIAGRLSDRTRSRIGRRTPYMAVSLIIMGAATWMFTVVQGYWLLVLFIVIARQAASVFTLTNVAVVPEVFGRSRWLKALVLTTALGTLASLVIKATVITTWKQSMPETWNLPFQVAAVIMGAVGITVLVLVRESKAASFGAAADRKARARPARAEIREILDAPNAKVLLAGSLLFWAGLGSTAYVAILFFQRVVHAGASAQTIAGLASGIPTFLIGILLGIPLSRALSRRQLAIGAPLIGALLAGVQYFDTHIWQAVVLAFIGAPFVGAYIIVLAPYLLRLLPRAGGLGERLGLVLSPFNLVGVVLAYVAATVVDVTGNYRLIWVFPAATGIAHALVNTRLRFPARRPKTDMVAKLWQWSVAQSESMAESGIVAGLLAAPLVGEVTKEDADSAVIVDVARDILGDPYEDERAPDESEGDADRPPVEGDRPPGDCDRPPAGGAGEHPPDNPGDRAAGGAGEQAADGQGSEVPNPAHQVRRGPGTGRSPTSGTDDEAAPNGPGGYPNYGPAGDAAPSGRTDNA
jgi:Na+/melibiose symporter-like transporter